MTDQRFTIQEIAEAISRERSTTLRRAARECWPYTEKSGRGGRRRLYALTDLPTDVQTALVTAHGSHEAVADDGDTDPLQDSAALWAWYERQPDSQKQRAQAAHEACVAIRQLLALGQTVKQAIREVGSARDIPPATARRWWYSVKDQPAGDWLPHLCPRYVGRTATAEISTEAWEMFKADYLRRERPALAKCYQRTARAAQANGWAWPHVRTIERKCERDIARATLVLEREGPEALDRLMPAMQRDKRVFHAMEAVNGDGKRFKRVCIWPDGTKGKPAVWLWQDLRSGLLLAWRDDTTENADVLRLAYGEMVERYGIPTYAYIDNTRAAANKWLTGRTELRFRWKLREEDPLGIMPQVGTTPRFVQPYHGQSKPIERANRELKEIIDRHPQFASRGTQDNPIPIEEFREVLAAEIAAYNARAGRRSPICQGRSFQEVFDESYGSAAIRKATAEQRRLWLLAAEKIRCNGENGSVVLGRGPQGENRYWHERLAEHAGRTVVVRFDPQQLHQSVHIYTLDGRYLCEAPCTWRAGFADTQAAREYHRARQQWKRHTKRAADAETRMSAHAAAQQLPEIEQPEPPAPRVVSGRFSSAARVEADGAVVDTDTGEILDDDREQQFANAVAVAHQRWKKDRV
ncbi:MAG: transposase domain-containing protein [Salinisphaeraceae bacterium]